MTSLPIGGERRRTTRLETSQFAARTAAALAIVGAATWTVALVAGPFLRPDLDLLTAHPEAYAQGPWAPLMQAGYVGIAAGGAAAALLARRYLVAAGLLAAFAAGALVIGLLPPGGPGTLADAVFPYAQLAPLGFLPASAWISRRVRRRPLVLLAALAWLLFLPLVLGDPPAGGILNRLADLALGAWLAAFALIGRDAPAR